MDEDLILRKSAIDLAKNIHTGKISSLEVTKFYLERIKKYDDCSFLKVTEKRAIEEAMQSDKRISEGYVKSNLDGIPIAWKDLLDIENFTTTAGSVLYSNRNTASSDANVVKKVKEAGMVCLGKLNLTELAYSGLGLNPHYGTPKNVSSDKIHYVPGGSSSGSGVSVARNLVCCSIGTDTGGSVRVPACFNGIVGFKTSEGRYNREGLSFLSRNLDTIGPLARSVEDCIEIDKILRSHSTNVNFNDFNKKEKILFIPKNVVLDDLDFEVEESFFKLVEKLKSKNFKIKYLDLDIFSYTYELFQKCGTITAFDAFMEHRSHLTPEMMSLMDERVLDRILPGKKMSLDDVNQLFWNRIDGIEKIQELVGNNFLIMPTCPILAPMLNKVESNKKVFHELNLMSLRNTMLGNYFNMPGVTLPLKTLKNNMHSGFMIYSRFGMDEMLLSKAKEIETIL